MRFKLLVVLFFLGLWSYVLSPTAFADSGFNISAFDSYSITPEGKANISHQVEIINKTKYLFAPSYSLNVPYSDVDEIKATNSAGFLKTELLNGVGGPTIKIYFPKKIIGIGKKNKFTVSYATSKVAVYKKMGWEITIPKLSDAGIFSNYTVDVSVPDSFGQPSIIAPPEENRDGNTYSFKLSDFEKSGIYMFFKKNDNLSRVSLTSKFSDNIIFGFPIKGSLIIKNQTDQSIRNQILTVDLNLPQKQEKFLISQIPPYSAQVVALDLGTTPFLTMQTITAKISFDGSRIQQNINVGLLPDNYLLILGGIIFGGSIIVAVFAVKTWRLHFQKR